MGERSHRTLMNGSNEVSSTSSRAHGLPLTGRGSLLAEIVAELQAGAHTVLRGPAGIGKTRLAHEAVQQLAGQGRNVQLLMASEATSDFQFGALAPIGYPPKSEPGDVTMALGWYLSNWRRQGTAGGPVVVWVDDAQHLDSLSALMLRHAVTASVIQLVATHRTPEQLPSDIEAMATDGSLTSFDVPPLEREDAGILARLVCPRKLTVAEVNEVTRLGGGRPLLLRELALAVDAPDSNLTAGFDSQISRRISRLPPAERRTLEMIAVAEPLPASVLVEHRDELAGLIGSGIVQTHGANELRLEHPLYSEWVVRALGPRSVEVYRDLIAAAPDETDSRLLVEWHLCADIAPSPSLASAATRAALTRSDTETAFRFVSHTPPGERLLLEGQALLLSGSVADGLEMLASVYTGSESSRTHAVEAATFAARFVGLVLGDQAEAHRILSSVDDASLDPLLRRVLLNGRLWLWMFGPGPDGSELDLVHELLSSSLPIDQTSYDLAISAGAVTYLVHGAQRADGIIRRMREIESAVEPDRDSLARARSVEAWHLLLCGQASAAVMLVSEAFETARQIGDAESVSLLGGTGGLVTAMSGDLVRGCRMSEIGQSDPEVDWWRWKVMARLTLAGSSCLLGRVDRAKELFEHVQPDSPGLISLDLEDAIRARARYLIDEASGSPVDEAFLMSAFEQLAATHKSLWIAVFAAEICDSRSGSAILRFIADQLERIESNDISQTVRSATLARLDGDNARLLRASLDFELAGLVAGASRGFADVLRDPDGSSEFRSEAVAGIMRMARRWNGAPAAWLADINALPTARQLEIAFAVAGGESQAAIAERLFLSVRTVQNHLYRTSQSMAVSGQDELAAMLRERVAPAGWTPTLV